MAPGNLPASTYAWTWRVRRAMPAEESPTSSGDASICCTWSAVHAMARPPPEKIAQIRPDVVVNSQLLLLLRLLDSQSREKTLAPSRHEDRLRTSQVNTPTSDTPV